AGSNVRRTRRHCANRLLGCARRWCCNRPVGSLLAPVLCAHSHSVVGLPAGSGLETRKVEAVQHNTMRQNGWVRATVVSNFIAAAIVLFFLPASATNRWGADYFPNVPLTTQDGIKVHFYDDLIKGKIVVIDLIYTHCVDACPLETARLAQVQKMLGDRVGKDI